MRSILLPRPGWLFALAAFSCLAGRAVATDLVEVTPITHQILCLHFDEGRVAHHGAGQKLSADTVYAARLAPGGWSADAVRVSSETDEAYRTPRAPVRLGRKSKGTEFAEQPGTWQANYGFRTHAPYVAAEHWVYLFLPEPLRSGSRYTVSWNGPAAGTSVSHVTLVYDEAALRAESVHVNALGYRPSSAAKYAYLYHWMGDRGGVDLSAWDGRPFHVVRVSDGSPAFTGTIRLRKPADNVETSQSNPPDTPGRNFLGSAVWECDFSSLSSPGLYRVIVPGLGSSWPFRLDEDIYREAFRSVMRGIFQQRSGVRLAPPFADELRPAPHHVADTPNFSGRLRYSTTRSIDVVTDGGGATERQAIEQGAKGQLTKVWGWYQDAGDWDGYFRHLDIPAGLLGLYQLRPDAFLDDELTISESGNGLPDLVDEGAWLPRFLYRLRQELQEKGWGTGGVGARVFGDYWGPDLSSADGEAVGRPSWQDTDRTWYVTGEDPFATFRYAGNAAQLAEILARLERPDPDGIDWAREASEAYAWAVANVRSGDEQKTGEGAPLSAQRAFAAVSLYRLTGDAAYGAQSRDDLLRLPAGRPVDHQDIAGLAAALYLTSGRPLDEAAAQRCGQVLRASVDELRQTADQRALRWGGNSFFPMLVGHGTTPMITTAVWAHRALAGRDDAAAAGVVPLAETTADYFLGTNPLNLVWITGVGPRFPRGIFHLDDRYAGPGLRRGIVPYGPWRFPDTWIDHRMAASIWWAWDTTYPAIDPRGAFQSDAGAVAPGTWPGHEAWFDHALSPQAGEFTVWQNNLHAAIAYGFLAAAQPDRRPLAFRHLPASVTLEPGMSTALYAIAEGPANLAYQWSRDGVSLPGANTPVLELRGVTRREAGAYTLQISDRHGSLLSPPVTVSVRGEPSRLANLSVRAPLSSAQTLIVGFVSEGAPKEFLVRAVGPGLARFAVPAPLADPLLTLYHGTTSVGGNDNWDPAITPPARFASVGAFGLTTGSRDAALLHTVSGGYTAHLLARSAGTALVEIYDADAAAQGRLRNLSARQRAGTGDEVLIAGFQLTGPGSKRLLIRAVGPRLADAPYRVGGTLRDPKLTLFDGHGRQLAENDDWGTAVSAGEFSAAGAFPLDSDIRSAALRVNLPGDALYTVHVTGADGTGGEALIEIYDTD